MKKMILSAALAFSSMAFASTWDVDTAHATAEFGVKHLSITTVKGNLGPITGTVELDDKDLTKSTVSVSIDVKGIDTRNSKRDDHLKSPDFFDVEKFPTATFKSTKIEDTGDVMDKVDGKETKVADKVKVTGTLTMHGVEKKDVVLEGTISGAVANPFDPTGSSRAVALTTSLNRDEFGLTWKGPKDAYVIVGREVKVEINAEIAKAKPAAAAAPAKDAKPAAAPAKK